MVDFSPIVFGAGAFNTQYNKDPALGDAATVLQYAFEHGINTIDTAALYGPSEVIVGDALAKLNKPRGEYNICTKCCRWETGEFVYSRETVLNSFSRSLERLKTDYVDVLYVHDVEFGSPENVLEAVKTAFELKDQGKVKLVGISGLPVWVLVATAEYVRAKLCRPVDIVLSYCNLTLQNSTLPEFKAKLEAAGVKIILNASPISMSLLRSRPTHDFHPAPPELREKASEIGNWLQSKNIEFADVATQYSFGNWEGSTVIGLRSTDEIDAVIRNRETGLQKPETQLWEGIQKRFGEWHNYMWQEEPTKETMKLWANISA